jgi:hypothetical protein
MAGQDVGAIGPSGTYEKDIVLAVARELVRLINRQPGMRAVMTRDGDYFLPLRTRMDRGPRQARGPVRLGARRRGTGPACARLVGLRAVAARRQQRSGQMAGGQ